MHVIVIRWDTYDANSLARDLAAESVRGVQAARYAALYETTALKYMLPFLTDAPKSDRRLMGDDPSPTACRATRKPRDLPAVLLRARPEPAPARTRELFAAETLDLSRI